MLFSLQEIPSAITFPPATKVLLISQLLGQCPICGEAFLCFGGLSPAPVVSVLISVAAAITLSRQFAVCLPDSSVWELIQGGGRQ